MPPQLPLQNINNKKNAVHSFNTNGRKCGMFEGKSEQKDRAVLIVYSYNILSLQNLQKHTTVQTHCKGSSSTFQGSQVREEFEDSTSTASK